MVGVAANMSLGGVPLRANPNEVRWDFKMKTSATLGMGGRVVQVLGTRLGDIVVKGEFGMGRADLGEREGWEAEQRMRHQVNTWAERVRKSQNKILLRFTYSPRNWDFQVFVKSMNPIEHTVQEINPAWQLTLMPIDAVGLEVQRGVRDMYLRRLMDGIGWKQTEYNGPNQAQVDETLGDLTVQQYVAQQAGEAFIAGTEGQTFLSTRPGVQR
jgi:hypothetical protein